MFFKPWRIFPKDYIVIDIGAANIKLLEAKYEKEKIMVKNFFVLPTPANSYENGVVFDTEKVSDRIKEVLRNSKIKTKNAIVLLTGDTIINREILLPKMKENELQNAVIFEAEQSFPVDLSGYKVDYKIIEEVEEQYRILLTAVPQAMIDNYVDLVKKCELDLKVIDIAENALVKFTELEMKTMNVSGVICVIDLGASMSRLVIIDDRKFKFGRLIKFGFNEIVSIVSDSLSLKFKASEELLLKKYGNYFVENSNVVLVEDREQIMLDNIRRVLLKFCDDISRLIEFYYSRNYGKRIAKIILVGGGAKFKGIEKFLTQNLEINSQMLEGINCVINMSAKSLEEDKVFLANVLGGIIR